ncbi:hypothetical protein OAP93_01535 [Candidatus Pelagibacter ubique]|nr:hypothetical protein [Candidatus Pelagibacter ubique]
MEKKNERIIGLVIGLIGLVFLFHFSFGYGGFLTDASIVARMSNGIIYFLKNFLIFLSINFLIGKELLEL